MAYSERDPFTLGPPINNGKNENEVEKKEKLTYLILKLGSLILEMSEINNQLKQAAEEIKNEPDRK